MKLADTPITHHTFNGHPFYLKRDDLLHPEFSGNKARKFMALLEDDYPKVTTLIGYGSPQANSLYSLAALAKLKGWQLEFYVDHIPNWLKQNPIGNYQAALALGAKLIEVSALSSDLHPSDYIKQIRQPDEQCLFVEEGGRSPIAERGIKQLAQEIIDWKSSQGISALTVALPSGTGTTALYLTKHLTPQNILTPNNIDVITCACVGGKAYLTQQFDSLNEPLHPTILTTSLTTDGKAKHQFGKLYAQDYQIWQQLKQQTNIEFDLLYDPYMWQCLQHWQKANPNKPLLYIHQGGLLGNISMEKRYQRKFI
ncbi:1-aminocyclopropane-1-carboxylate deaminase/D-cysteine desulfhydrase [Vibrio litoralis]|uniref:1-aminocyclopropane-1-carboxylate deaminase/D-cysteine desulfhydrase n=1 Tax=Vibrio litoralis TaxID=335972 RepID=UPI00040069E8|nr:1-aminocyclopropane-1-carboxylate deaminase/D-cysteine desulfhydrase [Vibrio litoralis]